MQLVIPPFDEIGIAVDIDHESHVGVLNTAEFSALPAIDPDLPGDDRDVRKTARNEVLLAREARHPETMDDIVRLKHDAHWNTHRKVDFICCAHDLRRFTGIILNVPPPLIGRHCKREFFMGCGLGH